MSERPTVALETMRHLTLVRDSGAAAEDLGGEVREPLTRLRPVPRDELTHELDRARASGDHGELGIEALQVELADDALVALADEEATRAGLELRLDEVKLPFSEPEPRHVILGAGVRIGKEHLGRGLLDHGPA